MRNPALRVFEQAARRAHGRSYSQRAMTLARRWQFPDGAHLLVPSPVFVLTTMKSGSTLLRTALDRHSRICAPHELHLGSWDVSTSSRAAQAAIEADGLDSDQLADLLWDRVLHLHLVRSKKSIIVDKTPRNALQWRRIVAHWPDAKFLVFTRHPLRVADEIALARPDIPAAKHHLELERYAVALHGATRALHNVLTVRYEDLSTDPAASTRSIAGWLDVPWEPEMLGYSNAPAPTGSRLRRRKPPEPTAPQRTPLALPAGPSLPRSGDVPETLYRACELLDYA